MIYLIMYITDNVKLSRLIGIIEKRKLASRYEMYR